MDPRDVWMARLGPVLRTLGFAAAAFLVLWAVAPHLTVAPSSGSVVAGASTESSTTTTDPYTSATTPTTVAPAATTVVPRVASGTALRREETWDARGHMFADDPGWPASLEATGDLMFEIYPTNEQKDGVIFDRSFVEWNIQVTNRGDERLWGLFVYLELAGRATCDDRILDPDESATCTVRDIAFLGAQTADVWATAWDIDDDMSADRILHPYVVAARPHDS